MKKEKSELERDCLNAIGELQATRQKLKKVNVARKLYPQQNIRAAQVSLSRRLSKYNLKFEKLVQTFEAQKQLAPKKENISC